MAYAIGKKSIFRRVLALVMCCCLLLCVAVPRAHAVADPITIAVSGVILVTTALIAFGFMDAVNAGEAFSDMVASIVNSGIDLSWLTPFGLAEVLSSAYDDIVYAPTELLDTINRQALFNGFYLDGAFSYRFPELSDGAIFRDTFSGNRAFIEKVYLIDDAFRSSMADNQLFINLLNVASLIEVEVDAYGVRNIDFYPASDSYYWELDLIDNATSSFVCRSSTGTGVVEAPKVSFTRDDSGAYSRTDSVVSSFHYYEGYWDFNQQYFVGSPSWVTLFNLGTLEVSAYEFAPPAVAPDISTSVTTLFPDWAVNESDSALPIYCPGTEAEALEATQEQAQIIQFPEGGGDDNGDNEPNYVPNFKSLETIINALSAGIIAKFLDLFGLLERLFQDLTDTLVTWFDSVVDWLGDIWWQVQQVYYRVGEVITSIEEFSVDLQNKLDVFLQNLLRELAAFNNSILDDLFQIRTWIETFFETLVENWHDFWDGLISKVSTLSDVVSDHLANFWENLQAKLQPLLDPIIEAIEQLPKGFRDWKEKFKRFLVDGFGFTNIWHYVTSWIGCISGFVGQILAIWSKLPYCMVVPVYACVTLTIVFGLYRRFIR